MPQTIAFELSIPGDLARLRMPRSLNARLQELLDRQDDGQKLTPAERGEAEGLVDVAEMLSLLRAKSRRRPARSRPKRS